MEGSPVGDCFPGKVVGNYTLQEQIGKGSFGSVFKGVDRRQSGFCAIKIISRAYMFDKDEKPTRYKECFDREVHAMRMIKHPKIIKLREKLQSGNNYYLVLDYCEDGDLNQYLEAGRMKEGDAIDALKQLALGFQELHRLGIMHRDFKPANVFIHRGNFIIGDLGMAKQASATTSKVGTPITMAPEVSERSGKPYDSTVDLFSLGVTFYYMLFKEWPWKIDYMLGKSMRTKVGPKLEFPDDDEISEETKTLLRKMIALRPDRLNWQQFFQLLDTLKVQGTFLRSENQAFNDMLFKLGVKQANQQADVEATDADPDEAIEIDIEKVKLLLELGMDPELMALLVLAAQQRPPPDSSEFMKLPDVKFWFGQIEHNRNLVRFYMGHCDFLKQNWKIRAEFPQGFGDLLLQLGLALMHKARTFLSIAYGFITKQIPTEDFPKIDNYLKTQHAKTVLEDLENFRKAVQGQFLSLISKAAAELKENEKNSTKAMEWVELIKVVEIEKQGLKEVNKYCKEKLQQLLKMIPHVDNLRSADYDNPITSKMLVSFLRIYQMVYEDDEMPKAKSDDLEAQWKNFFKQPITVDLIKTNYFKAKGRLT